MSSANAKTCLLVQSLLEILDALTWWLERGFKGGYLHFSHLTELKNIYITEIYMRKQYKSSKIKNKKITKQIFLMRVPLKGYVAS